MIPYYVKGIGQEKKQRRILAALLIIAVVIAYFLNCWLETLEDFIHQFLVPFLPAFSVPFLFGLLFGICNRLLWRFGPLKKYLPIPDLNGDWYGTLNRESCPNAETLDSYEERADNQGPYQESALPVHIRIRQRMTRISYHLDNESDGKASSGVDLFRLVKRSDQSFLLNEAFHINDEIFGTSQMKVNLGEDKDTLIGDYVSSAKRSGSLNLQRCKDTEWRIKGKIEHITDSENLEYLAVRVDSVLMKKYMTILQKSNSIEDFATFTENRQKRDGKDFHVTVISPPEYKEIHCQNKVSLEKLMNDKVSMILSDISCVKRNTAEDWYVVVKSPKIDYLRTRLGLPAKELHVTLGFIGEPIYDVPKTLKNRSFAGPKRSLWQKYCS